MQFQPATKEIKIGDEVIIDSTSKKIKPNSPAKMYTVHYISDDFKITLVDNDKNLSAGWEIEDLNFLDVHPKCFSSASIVWPELYDQPILEQLKNGMSQQEWEKELYGDFKELDKPRKTNT